MQKNSPPPYVCGLDDAEIRAIAIDCGFKLKPQPDGTEDLNPYVYKFANEILSTMPAPEEVARFRNALDAAAAKVEVVVTTDAHGNAVAVTRQDKNGRILSTIWARDERLDGVLTLAPDPVGFRYKNKDEQEDDWSWLPIRFLERNKSQNRIYELLYTARAPEDDYVGMLEEANAALKAEVQRLIERVAHLRSYPEAFRREEKRAAELIGTTHCHFNEYASQTGDKEEVELAMSKPETVFEHRDFSGQPWKEINADMSSK